MAVQEQYPTTWDAHTKDGYIARHTQPHRHTQHPSLPPSVEAAYRKKCIDLRQRIAEIEESNTTARFNVNRLQHGIRKLRLERAILLERLDAMEKSSADLAPPQREGISDQVQNGYVNGKTNGYASEGTDNGTPPYVPLERPVRTSTVRRAAARPSRRSGVAAKEGEDEEETVLEKREERGSSGVPVQTPTRRRSGHALNGGRADDGDVEMDDAER